MARHYVHRVWVIFKAFRHFFTIFCEDESVDNQVSEGRLILESGGEHVECVEPASRLVESFSDEVPWKGAGELVLGGGEGVMDGGVGHCPTLKPAVEHFRNATKVVAVLGNHEPVYAITVQVIQVPIDASSLSELGNRANALNNFVVLIRPNGNGIAPVAIPREAPVLCILKPIVETLLLRVARHPLRFQVVL